MLVENWRPRPMTFSERSTKRARSEGGRWIPDFWKSCRRTEAVWASSAVKLEATDGVWVARRRAWEEGRREESV